LAVKPTGLAAFFSPCGRARYSAGRAFPVMLSFPAGKEGTKQKNEGGFL